MKNTENCIEWIDKQDRVTLSLSTRKYITKIKKYALSNPEECDYIENVDNTIVAHVPLSWIKISPKKKRVVTEE